MKTLIVKLANVERVEISPDCVTLHYADEPKIVSPAPLLDKPKADEPELTDVISNHFRGMQQKSAKARLANETPEARKLRMRKMSEARWGKLNRKSSAQIENEAARDLIGKLCTIAKRNEAAKQA